MKRLTKIKFLSISIVLFAFISLPILHTQAEETAEEHPQEQNTDEGAPKADSVWGAMKYTGYHIKKGSITAGHAIKEGSVHAGKTMEKGFKKAGSGIESGSKKAGHSIKKFFTGDD